MKRRDFFRNSSLSAAGLAISPLLIAGNGDTSQDLLHGQLKNGTAKNIIFLVSDGMSAGTLNMADLFLKRLNGKSSVWVENIKNGTFKRSMMDTASASSLVTDSAAGGSAWGGGYRVPNGSLNVSANGQEFKPVLQKFKAEGKSVGCVTTVPITHATPASFCVNMASRSNQAGIAVNYLDLKFDVMLGGGDEYFSAEKRKDKRDLYGEFQSNGFSVAKRKQDLAATLDQDEPVLGVFGESALPFTVDQQSDNEAQQNVPTLSEMTAFAIEKMKNNANGFVLQVEGGKVDWAAHSNDTGGLIYDQVEFDKAVGVALKFAQEDENTLIIVTTDHGNANPGLFYGSKADENFDKIQAFKHSNKWLMDQVMLDTTPTQLKELVEYAQSYALSDNDATYIMSLFKPLNEEQLYDDYKKPFAELARIQKRYTSVGWGDMHHSSDYVEVAAFGPGSELLPAFIENTFLHNMMLTAAGIKK